MAGNRSNSRKSFIEKLKVLNQEYVFLVEDVRYALELYDAGIRVAVGNIDDPETYRKMQIDQASLVVATSRDEVNVNTALTVRELNEKVPVLTQPIPSTPSIYCKWPAVPAPCNSTKFRVAVVDPVILTPAYLTPSPVTAHRPLLSPD